MDLEQCTLIYLENEFGLKPIRRNVTLQQWLETPIELSEFEKQAIEALRDLLDRNVFHWNEQELALQFIGPIFSLIDFTTTQSNLFALRPIKAVVKNVELKGKPDGMIASGYREPKSPYFCFHEYKRELENAGDPAGQCLAAMLVGQALNENRNPMYGAYVVGRAWYFVILEGDTYSISKDYSAVTEDILAIVCILKALKEIIAALLPNLEPAA